MNKYDVVYSVAQEVLGAKNVYQFLPMKEVEYPFATIQASGENYSSVKIDNLKDSSIVIDLWGKYADRHKLEVLSTNIIDKVISLGASKGDTNYKIMLDDSAKGSNGEYSREMFWHSIVEVIFYGA